ncbi:MAG TPA: hypothetical protein VNX88_00430 [Terriglobales bacterium]|jgi:hypothetical protein|nr:hypothetical protein [Terriglobales bacterium]
MKKSFRLLIGTIMLGAVIVAASISPNQPGVAGGAPVPVCPPDGCAVN